MVKNGNSENNKTETQLREKWGRSFIDENGKGKDYTDAEIEELERIYRAQAAEFKGAITPRIEYNLQKLSKLELEQQKAMAKGDGQEAKRYADMVKDIKRSEGMQAGDSKPTEAIRIDSIIAALERKGFVKDGGIVSQDTLKKLLCQDNGQYKSSIDIVDSIILAIINTMRTNAGEGELMELPITAQIIDHNKELQDTTSIEDKTIMDELGIIPPRRQR